jgi:hypothetical protein
MGILKTKERRVKMLLAKIAVPPNVSNAKTNERRLRIAPSLSNPNGSDTAKVEDKITEIIDFGVDQRL